jgi:hypothetical protein
MSSSFFLVEDCEILRSMALVKIAILVDGSGAVSVDLPIYPSLL